MKKNKICLITFHTPINYGAVLQAYSLQKYLEIYSDDVKIIDYNTFALTLSALCQALFSEGIDFVFGEPSVPKKKKK